MGAVQHPVLRAAGRSAAKALGTFPPSYVQFTAIPFDLANKYPVVQQLIDDIHGAVPNAKLTSFTLSSMSSWLLWAQSAKACGSKLTVDCVLQAGADQLVVERRRALPAAEPDARQPAASPCIALVKLTTNGFVYDEKATNPTKGMEPFNCDADNVKKVKTYVTTS